MNKTHNEHTASRLGDMALQSQSRNEMGDLEQLMNPLRNQLLWEIMFATELSEIELLKSKVFAYGQQLREEDSFERKIFVSMVSLLRNAEERAILKDVGVTHRE